MKIIPIYHYEDNHGINFTTCLDHAIYAGAGECGVLTQDKIESDDFHMGILDIALFDNVAQAQGYRMAKNDDQRPEVAPDEAADLTEMTPEGSSVLLVHYTDVSEKNIQIIDHTSGSVVDNLAEAEICFSTDVNADDPRIAVIRSEIEDRVEQYFEDMEEADIAADDDEPDTDLQPA